MGSFCALVPTASLCRPVVGLEPLNERKLENNETVRIGNHLANQILFFNLYYKPLSSRLLRRTSITMLSELGQ